MNKSRKRWIIFAGFLAVLAGLMAYPSLRNSWLIQRAQKSFAEGDDRKAALQAMRVIQIAPNYTPASRLIADIAEKNHSRDALRWRMSVVNADPSSENQIALARTALSFQEWEWADKALLAVKPADRESIIYLETSGALALAINSYDNAARLFEKSLQLDPANKNLLFNLSVTRLASPDPALKAKARQDLQQLKLEPAFANQSILALLQDALSTHSSPAPLVKELLALPNLPFSQRLTALDVLARLPSSDTAGLLADLQKSAVEQAGETYVLSNWLVRQGRAAEARQWLDSLKPEQLARTPVPMAYAECLVALKDWKTLGGRLSKEKWPDAEVMRQAFLWKSRRELNPSPLSEAGLSDWKQFLRRESVLPAELYLVANLFWSWGWKSEAEDLWWTLAEQAKNPERALKTLDQIYRSEKNTSQIWRVSQRASLANPRNKVAQNNYAMLSLLLNVDSGKAHTLAESLYREQPENPAFLSTYAFSLYRKGQTKEALRLFSTLNPKLLEVPEYAFYYALFLKTEGKEAESIHYAQLAEKAALLPEERALLP